MFTEEILQVDEVSMILSSLMLEGNSKNPSL